MTGLNNEQLTDLVARLHELRGNKFVSTCAVPIRSATRSRGENKAGSMRQSTDETALAGQMAHSRKLNMMCDKTVCVASRQSFVRCASWRVNCRIDFRESPSIGGSRVIRNTEDLRYHG